MKIISNFRDFYDYLNGVYGIDEKIVYERICSTENAEGKWWKSGVHKADHLDFPTEYKFYMLAICGVIYCVYYYNRKFYFFPKDKATKDWSFANLNHIKSLTTKKKLSPTESLIKELLSKIKNPSTHTYTTQNYKDMFVNDLYYLKYNLEKTDINDKENCPVCLISKTGSRNELEAGVLNPKLSDYGIAQIISPNEMYLSICSFLTREKKVVDTRTDIEKLTGKGFDKKTSFRKM